MCSEKESIENKNIFYYFINVKMFISMMENKILFSTYVKHYSFYIYNIKKR